MPFAGIRTAALTTGASLLSGLLGGSDSNTTQWQNVEDFTDRLEGTYTDAQNTLQGLYEPIASSMGGIYDYAATMATGGIPYYQNISDTWSPYLSYYGEGLSGLSGLADTAPDWAQYVSDITGGTEADFYASTPDYSGILSAISSMDSSDPNYELYASLLSDALTGAAQTASATGGMQSGDFWSDTYPETYYNTAMDFANQLYSGENQDWQNQLNYLNTGFGNTQTSWQDLYDTYNTLAGYGQTALQGWQSGQEGMADVYDTISSLYGNYGSAYGNLGSSYLGNLTDLSGSYMKGIASLGSPSSSGSSSGSSTGTDWSGLANTLGQALTKKTDTKTTGTDDGIYNTALYNY